MRPATFTKKLKNAPFPYYGKFEDTGADFYDGIDAKTRKKFHTLRNGTRVCEKGHYDDSRVVFHVPPHFDVKKSFFYVVYFHGNKNEVVKALRVHKIIEQVDASLKNVILITPQLAKNTADVSAGKFYTAGAFRKFMNECADVLAEFMRAEKSARAKLKKAPVVLVPYSGGYKPAAFILERGGVSSRVRGLICFDALYRDADKYKWWLLKNFRRTFFICFYTKRETQKETKVLMKFLDGRGIRYVTSLPEKISEGSFCFRSVSTSHYSLPLLGPPAMPLSFLLRRLCLS